MAELTRREFVKVSGGLVGGVLAGAAVGGPLLQRARAGDETPVLRVGLIGCGGRGTGAALQALAADSGCVLYAMADVFPERIDASLKRIQGELERPLEESEKSARRGVPEQVDVPEERRSSGFNGYQKVVELCDVVLLATPPHFRPAHLRAAVEAGRHIFCEKPVAVDAPGVRSVLESAEMAGSRGRSLVSGFCWRYSTRERETIARVHAGAIGPLRAVYTTYNAGGFPEPHPRGEGSGKWSDMEFQLRNWHYFTWLSGDHMVEQACHSIDKIAWAMNGALPVRCTAAGGRQSRPDVPETGNIFDHFSATYEYPDGARAFHMCRHFPDTPFDNSDYIMGADGVCRIDGWSRTHEITGKNAWKCEAAPNSMYQQEHDELFASIRSGKPINDGVWAAHSTLMAVMARMAAYTGQTVTWEQALESRDDLSPPRYEWGELPVRPVARPGFTKLI
jgi:myo-inositol 2-dehydrogenase / D-chiro-inositol 1-dehydrogenase